MDSFRHKQKSWEHISYLRAIGLGLLLVILIKLVVLIFRAAAFHVVVALFFDVLFALLYYVLDLARELVYFSV